MANFNDPVGAESGKVRWTTNAECNLLVLREHWNLIDRDGVSEDENKSRKRNTLLLTHHRQFVSFTERYSSRFIRDYFYNYYFRTGRWCKSVARTLLR